MIRFALWSLTLTLSFPLFAMQSNTEPAPVEVMVLGMFHMANPGQDVFNVEVDDMLAPARRQEIVATVDALARFKPHKIALEVRLPESSTLEVAQYPQYLAGKLEPDRDESFQLGYRLAAQLKHEQVYGIDVEGDLDFDAVFKFAAEHGQQAMVDAQMQLAQGLVGELQQHLQQHTVGAHLYWMNDPQSAVRDHGLYASLLRVGNRKQQPGAALMADWTRRNWMICGRLVQISNPGERIVVMFGAGHSFLLRQCVQQMPGFKLVEPREWLSEFNKS